MEPEIRYATTADGVSIAFTRTGSGSPIVIVPNIWGTIAIFSSLSTWLVDANTAHGRETITLDARGTGASQRDVSNISLETRLLDLAAVVDHLGLERFTLLAISHGGPATIAYAARHPERVENLILIATYADGSDYARRAPAMRSFAAMAEISNDQWAFFTRASASTLLGFAQADAAERLAAVFQDSCTPEMLTRYREAARETNVARELANVKCPTLVLDPRTWAMRVEEQSRELAMKIPGARIVTHDGNPDPTASDPDTEAAIWAFLEPESHTGPEPRVGSSIRARGPAESGMTAILFTDIADSTALTERLGDNAFRTAARTLDEQLRAAIRDAGGTTIEGKTLGDGVLATFTSAAQAIDAARKALELSAASELQLHIGIHAGDVIRESDNVFGGAVNIAARISALSAPNEILVSRTVTDLARTSAGVSFEDRGDHLLKGIEEPQHVFAVRKAGA
jgi:class 3 adenylate cyclase/pimeloyl-ACP methyl ester carboxylesterase